MKIALVGTHGSGKTTLAKQLSRKLNIPIASLTVESVFLAYQGLTPEETTGGCPIGQFLEGLNHKEQLNFSRAAFRAQAVAEHGKEQFIADNSLIQQLGLMLYYASFGSTEFEFGTLYRSCYSLAEQTYDYVFYLPSPTDVVGDGIRPESKYVSQAIDHILLGLLRESDFRYWVLPRDQEERVLFVRQVVGK